MLAVLSNLSAPARLPPSPRSLTPSPSHLSERRWWSEAGTGPGSRAEARRVLRLVEYGCGENFPNVKRYTVVFLSLQSDCSSASAAVSNFDSNNSEFNKTVVH
ncbi:hypothetical protein KIL84_016005, partial [Mauremys mutica]